MPREDVLPPIFGDLCNRVSNVRRKSKNEWSSTCPWCGGEDRFVLFAVGRHGFPFAFCRHDPENHRWSPQRDRQLTKEELEEFRRQQIEIEKERIEAAKRMIEILQNDKIWERFYENNNDIALKYYAERGIPKTWVDYLKLGYIPDYTVYTKENGEKITYTSPSFTIPVWGVEEHNEDGGISVRGVVQNIKVRVQNPRNNNDRYRTFYPAKSSYLFVPCYDLPLNGAGVLVEGEFKAIVTERTIDHPYIRVVGLQSKTPFLDVLKPLDNLDPIYIMLDPDAMRVEPGQTKSAAMRLAEALGKERCLLVELPCKVDDGIVQYGLDPLKFMRMGRRVR